MKVIILDLLSEEKLEGQSRPSLASLAWLSCHLVAQSCPSLCDPMDWWALALEAPLSMGFHRQEYWTGLPFPPAGDLLDPGVKPRSPVLAGGFFTAESLGSEAPMGDRATEAQGRWPARGRIIPGKEQSTRTPPLH